MRPFSLLSLIFVLVLFPAAPAASDAEMFPLNPGSSWTYRTLEGKLETLTIIEILEQKGVPLVKASYDGNRQFYYIRGREGIFRLQPGPGADPDGRTGDITMLLRWPLDPGQSWQSPWTDPPLSFTVIDRGPTTVAAGTFRDVIKIGYRPVSSPIYQGYIWFEPGTGLVAQEESGYRLELVSYSLTDLLPPAPVDINGDILVGKFGPAVKVPKGSPPGYFLKAKDLLASAPFYLFMGLVFIGFVALVAYLNSGRMDMDMENDPNIQEGQAALASAMVREGLFEDAADILQRLSARNPQWPDIASLLGKAYRETGKYQEACLELKRALTLNPDMPKARLELVRTYLAAGDPARALEEVETVLAGYPRYPDALYLKGEVFICMGMDPEALELFRQALQINPSFREAQDAVEKLLAEKE